jgi:hypothetical protein
MNLGRIKINYKTRFRVNLMIYYNSSNKHSNNKYFSNNQLI